MATSSATAASGALSTRVVAGITGGLAGGAVFGVLMQMMNMISMVAMLVGSDSTAVGWLLHLMISAVIGASYALLLSRFATGVVPAVLVGLAYGAVWWVLGPLMLMPARLGMNLFVLDATGWRSLLGHLMYGLILGLVYGLVVPRTHRD